MTQLNVSNKPTLTEAIDTLLAEVFSPLQDASLFQTYMGEWKSEHSYEACVGVLESHGWHILKERQPADGEYCLLTIKQKLGALVPPEVFTYDATLEEFYPVSGFESDYRAGLTTKQVLAWTPLPQPYQKES